MSADPVPTPIVPPGGDPNPRTIPRRPLAPAAFDDGRHECPHPACEARLGLSVFSCRDHWFKLPARIRADIRGAWAGILRGDDDAVRRHDVARAEAML